MLLSVFLYSKLFFYRFYSILKGGHNMNIQSINNATVFGLNGQIVTKEIKGELKNGSTALLKLREKADKLIALDVFILKNEKLVGGWHTGNSSKSIPTEELVKCLKKLQANAKEGVNFVKEFMQATFS